MPQIITPTQLVLDPAGIPYAPAYGDIYHSRAGGYAQARGVFLAGNRLPDAWAGRRLFTILETGFGLGTNFLATWAAWRADARRPQRLHFVSIERHPFRADDLRAWHGRDAGMAALGEQLAASWPVLTAGLHRIELEQGQVVLTLALGDAATVLANLRMQADVLYLDGFAPARNADMWSAPVFQGLAHCAAPGATLATYTVSRPVVDGLAEAGFKVRKTRGFGGKPDMLVGEKSPLAGAATSTGAASSISTDRHALVIGAGIAGVSAASSLAARGWRVTLLDSADGVARGASSTPAGALHALLARDDSRMARFTRAAYLHMGARLAALPAAEWFGFCGRIDCLDDDAAHEQAAALITRLGLPPEFVCAVNVDDASELVGTRLARGGYWFPRGVWMHAGSYCNDLLQRAGAAIELRPSSIVGHLERSGEAWVASDAEGREIARAPVAILAAGLELGNLAGIPEESQLLPMQRMRGQLTGIPVAACHAPRTVVSSDGYCLPAVRGMLWTGATYGPGESDETPREQDHVQNLARLTRMLPDNVFAAMPAGIAAHVGFRAVAPDRLPLVGALPDIAAITTKSTKRPPPTLAELPRLPGLYASGAMASRGLTWAALSGEVIAAMIEGEAPPVEADLLESIDPARFVERRLRRGQFNPGE